MVITLLMKILFIICHVPSSLFSYFLFVFVLFAPILVCLSIIIIIIIIAKVARQSGAGSGVSFAGDGRAPLLFSAVWGARHTSRNKALEAIASSLEFIGVRQHPRNRGSYVEREIIPIVLTQNRENQR